MFAHPKLKAIAAAAGALAALTAASPASAYVYATSALEIDTLLLTVTGAGTTVGSYTFNLNNTASLNSGPVATGASCNSAGAPACNASLLFPVLDAAPANAVASTLNRVNNNFTFLGTNAVDSYSGADNVIKTAELVQGVPTSIQQIAESLLNTNGFAAANSLIQSNTSLSATLTVAGTPASIALTFLADPDQSSQIAGVIGNYLSQSDMNASFTLSGNGGAVSWTPNGTFGVAGSNDCTVTGALVGLGVLCGETADTQDLNRNTSTSTNPGTDNNSFEIASVLTAFGINITGLTAGTYTIAFNANTSTSIIRAVPEPATLALLGLALTGMGFASRRRNLKG